MRFTKHHALGNDYLVIEPADVSGELRVRQVQRICDRHYGTEADRILASCPSSCSAELDDDMRSSSALVL
jgi:diaminopimelate epimerase